MAIITRIREKSGLAVGIITIGLILFLIGGDLLSSNSTLLGRGKQYIGTIDGRDISLEEFSQKVEELRIQYEGRLGRSLSEQDLGYVREEAWNKLVYEQVFQKEYEKLGIEVTPGEVKDMTRGSNIHPSFAANFTDPKTGQMDQNAINQFFANFSKLPQQSRDAYIAFEISLRQERPREKYEKLLAQSAFVTKQEAENEYKAQNTRASIRYVFVPFTKIVDSTISVTEGQIKDYFNQHRNLYEREENRSIEYVYFSFLPSSADTARVRKELSELAAEFAKTKDDTAFVTANSEAAENIKGYSPNDLPGELSVVSLTPGEIYGPYVSEGKMKIFKLLGTKQDTVYSAKASHILLKWSENTPEAKKLARDQAEEVLKKLNKGERFEDLALMHSADPTNSNKGGDLGWFPQGRMVAPFEKAVFGATSVGVVPSIIETDFGYHIIKVTGVKTKDKFQIASIARDITAGEETRESAYRAAGVFAGVSTGEEFVKLSEETKALRLQALTIPRVADYINDIKHPKVREVVRWAYSDEVKPGSVSEVFEIGDKYLVAMLRGSSDKGKASLEDVREKVKAALIRELKAEQLLAKMNNKKGASLEDLATDNGVTVLTTEDVAITSSQLTGVGFAPVAIGKAFGMKAGQKTAPFKDENGVMVMEVTALNAAQSVADYNTYKQQLAQRRNGQVAADALRAIKKITKTEDYIAKYY